MKKKLIIFLLSLIIPVSMTGQNVKSAPASLNLKKAVLADPVITVFPGKLSKYDILYLSRSNNEATVTSLTYSIDAGGKTFTGDFVKVSDKFEVFIDLPSGLADIANVEKLEVTIKDNSNNIVPNGSFEIPLVIE